MAPDLVGASGLHDSPAVDHDDAIGQRQRLEQIVRHQHQCAVEGCELIAELTAYINSGLGVEGGEGLVEQQRRSAPRPAPAQGDTLGLATGELVRLGLLFRFETHRARSYSARRSLAAASSRFLAAARTPRSRAR